MPQPLVPADGHSYEAPQQEHCACSNQGDSDLGVSGVSTVHPTAVAIFAGVINKNRVILKQTCKNPCSRSGAPRITSGVGGITPFLTDRPPALAARRLHLTACSFEVNVWNKRVGIFKSVHILNTERVWLPSGRVAGLPPKCKIFAQLMFHPFRDMDQAFCFSKNTNNYNSNEGKLFMK